MTLRSILQKRHYHVPVCLELTNDIIIRMHGEKWPPGWAKSKSNGHRVTPMISLYQRDGSERGLFYLSEIGNFVLYLSPPGSSGCLPKAFLFFVFLKFFPCSNLCSSLAFALMPYLRSASTLGFSTLHIPNPCHKSLFTTRMLQIFICIEVLYLKTNQKGQK